MCTGLWAIQVHQGHTRNCCVKDCPMKGSWALELSLSSIQDPSLTLRNTPHIITLCDVFSLSLRNRNDTLRGERPTLWCFLLSSKRNLFSVRSSLWTLWLTHGHEVSQVLLMHCQHGHILTPADEKEDPLSKLIGWISHDNGRMKVTPFNKHPEKVCHHKVVVYGCNQTTPRLKKKRHGSSSLVNGKKNFSCMRLMVNTSLPHCSRGYCGRSTEAKTT